MVKESDRNPHIPQFYALVNAKCPRCRRGPVFINSMYGLKAQKMHEKCAHCGLKYEREPGYFYVSMFVSYAFSVAQVLVASILTYMLSGHSENPWLYIAIIFPVIFLFAPFNYRYSRLVLLYYLTPGLRYIPDLSRDRLD